MWLIEITGGPDEELNTPYTYEDLEDYYYPVLISGVQTYSGKDNINYVGHSNGCRVALTSLSKYYNGKTNSGYYFDYNTGQWMMMNLTANPVDKFFGIACPTTLNELEWSSEKMRKIEGNGLSAGRNAINELRNIGDTNINQKDFLIKIDAWAILKEKSESEISLNLQEFYLNLSLDKSSSFICNQNIANNYIFFAGTDNYYTFNNYGGDGVVPKQDLDLLNSSLLNSKLYYIYQDHSDIVYDSKVKTIIGGELK